MSRKLYPKLRIYVPVIIRGKESEGVKFWAFGKQNYQTLLSYAVDPDYGDITDLDEGHDLNIEIIPPEKSGKSFIETTIRVKPKPSPVGDQTVRALIKDQQKLEDLYPEPTYDELKTILNRFLDDDSEEQENATIEESSEELVVKPAEKKKTTTPENAVDEFDELFK